MSSLTPAPVVGDIFCKYSALNEDHLQTDQYH